MNPLIIQIESKISTCLPGIKALTELLRAITEKGKQIFHMVILSGKYIYFGVVFFIINIRYYFCLQNFFFCFYTVIEKRQICIRDYYLFNIKSI